MIDQNFSFEGIKKRIITFYRFVSVYSLLFFIASISIVTLSPIFDSGNINIPPPSQLNKGDIYQQTILAGRGQSIIVRAKAVYVLRITIVHEDQYSSYLENSSSQYTLFNQEVRYINYPITVHKYSRIFIFWNNSVIEDNSVEHNYISHTQSITGMDIDILLVSAIFLLLGLFIELGNHFLDINYDKSIFKIYRWLSLVYRKNDHSFNNPENKRANKNLVGLKELSLTINQNGMEKSKGYPIILMLLLWFVISPSKQFILDSHSGTDLTRNLLTVWITNMNQIVIAWTIIIGLLGFQLWKMKLETNELRNMFVLPIRRSIFGVGMLLNLIPSCSFAITLPFITSIILNILRFELIPEITVLIQVIIYMLFSSIVLILLGAITGLIRPFYTLYQGILLYYLLLGILYIPMLILFPNIIAPLPNGLELIYLSFQSQSLYLLKSIEFLIISLIIISSLIFIYIRSIQTLEVN